MCIFQGNQQNREFSYCGDYNIIKTVGQGSQAKVKIAEKNGERVALKIYKDIEGLQKEITALGRLKHPNIINLIEFHPVILYKVQQLIKKKKNGINVHRSCLVLELAKGGEIWEYICAKQFEAQTARFYFKQLLEALIFMKSQGVCHRDIKPQNLLLDSEYNLKVADFGLAAILDQNLNQYVGTDGTYAVQIGYIAPEILSFKEYDGSKADVFSAGAALFSMLTGDSPLNPETYKLLTKDLFQYFWVRQVNNQNGNPDFFPHDFRNLINGMMCSDPEKRFTFEQCLQHPWVQGPSVSHAEIKSQFRVYQYFMEIMKQNQVKTNQVGRQYRSTNNGEEFDFTDIENKFNLSFSKKLLQQGVETGMLNEIISNEKPEFLFCLLIKQANQFGANVNKVYDETYKVKFDIYDSGEVVNVIQVDFEELQDRLRINVRNLSGSCYSFHKAKHEIRLLIHKV